MTPEKQIYEDYRKLTNAFTDYNWRSFLNTLKVCVEFIEQQQNIPYSDEKYRELQQKINDIEPKNMISIRKSINQLVKMGFLEPFLTWVHNDSLEYLSAKTNKKRESLLSKIVYSKSTLNSSVNSISNWHQINFLIKTLIEVWSLSKENIVWLMLVNIEEIKKWYLTETELAEYTKTVKEIWFVNRKYNQISHLLNLLKKLDDIIFVRDSLYFKEDAENIFGKELKEETKKRDPYLHRLYKNQLQEESSLVLNWTKCMLEKLTYPVLIASHIKPFTDSNENESYDSNNWLLLSRNMDSLFDLWYITFDEDWNIIKSPSLKEDMVDHLSKYKLDNIFLNSNRKTYLEYHRNHVFRND